MRDDRGKLARLNAQIARPAFGWRSASHHLSDLDAPSDPIYADIPTSTELGIPAVADVFAGFLVPVETAADCIDILGAAIDASLQDLAIRQTFDAANLPIGYAGPAEFAQMLTNVTAFNRAELLRMGLITEYGGTLTLPCVAGSAPILPRSRTRATLRRMAMSIGSGGFPSALAAVMIGLAQSVRCTA